MRIVLFCLMLTSPTLLAQAYCGLRDPVAMIETMYPGYDNYQSIVRNVGDKVRTQVSERLPGMALHFGELGKHTLYVINQGNQVLGLVHVRSEQSEWGLVEIAWAINLDMSIKNFSFQRCRSRSREALESQPVRQYFSGKNLVSLIDDYDFNEGRPFPQYYQAVGVSDPLADVVLTCGLKTLLVTQLVWQQSITELTPKNSLGMP